MDRKVQERLKPDYKRIYSDLIELKHPEKKEKCKKILSKEQLSSIDIIRINAIIFGNNTENISLNQRHRSYDDETVQKILDYQKNNKLSNNQVAKHFKLSRNTVTKWKKIYGLKYLKGE
ncbi:helix-turn-helix domain-containing protein [Chryseobacterium antibioticum]|uniref:Helix-turn-helix domain-containing protein n=1 Tax=Chryseobacterium pyrolae TaxID=2987481 RepID=A0ABT2IKK5_9FLAO|nr:helix-turn-helix domain-containing protein [Chryseobacterium pyrolae]MCT2409139.1 helix-turn-helix domain-containing protein [Chryseobacterium pyrolae]